MTDLPLMPSALFLREAEVRRGIELLYFGYASMIRHADALLDEQGLGRAHHRALYFIARKPGLTVSELLDLLGITKQSLSRVLGELQTRALVTQRVGERDRRQRHLHLTEGGRALETQLFDCLRHSMADAYTAAGQQAVGGFWQVLTGLIQPGDREMVLELQRTLD